MYKRNYKKVDVMLFHPRIFSFVLLFLLFGCNTSSTEKICTVANEQTLTCNGGYSYWINPLYATSADVLAVSGVKKSNYYSQQWLVFLRSDLSEVILEHHFSKQFKADEHNAPAIIALKQGQWLTARTGHNNLSVDQKGVIEVTLFDNDLSVVQSINLEIENGSTYAQFVSAETKIYLLTRDKQNGWGVFISRDDGITWSDWQIINNSSGRIYSLLRKENRSGQSFERVILHTAVHPLENNQNIAYSYLDLNIDDPLRELIGDIRFGKEQVNNSFNSQLQVSSVSSTNIRLLDVYNDNDSLCHLYSSQNNVEQQDKWQLNIMAKKIDSDFKVNYTVGNFSGVLGDNVYITGASIKSCHYVDGDTIDVFVTAKQENTNKYQLLLVSLDAQTGTLLSETILYTSEKTLYRPVFIDDLNYVMFNEAEYWNSYENWLANQMIIKL